MPDRYPKMRNWKW